MPKLKIAFPASGILLVLMICFPAQTCAQTSNGNPPNWCRNGLFPSDEAEFKVATVGGGKKTKINFLSDDEGCPSAAAKCRMKSYLIAGDKALVSRKYGSWMCVWYHPRRGSEVVGWLPVDGLIISQQVVTPAIEKWVGEWKYYDNSLDIRRAGKTALLAVKGDAVWRGLGDNVHIGGVEAEAMPQGNQLTLNEEECRVTLKLVGDYIVASDNSECGGANVRFNGVFTLSRAGNVVHAPINNPQEKDSISFIRRRYASINKNLAGYKAVKKELAGFSTEGGELTAYSDGASIVKIATTNNGETNSFFEEFYYANDKLIFVYRKQEIYDEPMAKVVKIKENRFYFSDDKLIRWVDENAKQVAPRSNKYTERQNYYLNLSKQFTEGARSQEPTIEAPSRVR